MTQHLAYVSAVDWHPITEKIVSASHDKSIFVYTFNASSNGYIEEPVNFNQNKAILDVKWNLRGDKFVCSTSITAGVGYFNKENNWWEVKTIKCKLKIIVSTKIIC